MSRAPDDGRQLPVLEVTGLSAVHGRTTVLDEVELTVPTGPSALAIVGASGSGKTTLARVLLGLHPPVRGEVRFRGQPLGTLDRRARARFRAQVQPVFQDGSDALDPRMSVAATVAEGLRGQRQGRAVRRERVAELLRSVELDPALMDRRPGQLSGGQRQRVALARALAVDPGVLVLDEPTSALDVTVQARILTLLERLRVERGLALVLISHDLAVVDRTCEQLVVLERGRVIETGATAAILDRPAHPSTAALRAAVPTIDIRHGRRLLDDALPLATVGGWSDEPGRCHAVDRCPLVVDRCRGERPQLREVAEEQRVACHRAELQRAHGWQPRRDPDLPPLGSS